MSLWVQKVGKSTYRWGLLWQTQKSSMRKPFVSICKSHRSNIDAAKSVWSAITPMYTVIIVTESVNGPIGVE